MLRWIGNLFLVFLAIVVVTLIALIPLSTLQFSYREFGVAGVVGWYAAGVALSVVVDLRILRNPLEDRVRLVIGCLIAPLVVLVAAAVACLPLYLVLKLF